MAEIFVARFTSVRVSSVRRGGWAQFGRVVITIPGEAPIEIEASLGAGATVEYPGLNVDATYDIQGWFVYPRRWVPDLKGRSRERMRRLGPETYEIRCDDGANDGNFTDLIFTVQLLGRSSEDELFAALSRQKLAEITFQSNAEGKIKFGNKEVACLGNYLIPYHRDVTVDPAKDKFEVKHSDEFGVDMHWAVLVMWPRGIYVHEGPDNLNSNGGMSQGCIHLARPNAKTFYDWISEPTRVLVEYPWG